ncbi:PEP-CTERM sorting domain-containing protein [Massilia sp. PWRC2]|uniref:PEP-CTERM sorting domain-containing protein n=1 Tax=Massilia sp. PWRC2 TaxID=2804626 RepID=UPI003CF4E557
MQAFGLYVIGTRDVDGGDIALSSGAFRVSNRAVADVSDGAGSYAFFLGFMTDDGSALDPVSLLVLSGGDQRLLDIDIDDVILARAGGTGDVPEPASVPLMLAAALAFGAAGKRRALRCDRRARPITRLYYQRES